LFWIVATAAKHKKKVMSVAMPFTSGICTRGPENIGFATAKAFAEARAVVLVDINERALRAATEGLTSVGHRAISVTFNVADEGAGLGHGRAHGCHLW
jgi:hypothetical protein